MPEDNLLRMVYADWLDENGDAERAEFIRLQIRSLIAGSKVGDSRIRKLLAANRMKWRQELPVIRSVDWGPFGRGFVESATFRGSRDLREQIIAAFVATPIRKVHLCHCRPYMLRELVTSGCLSRVHELTARAGYVDDEVLELVANSPDTNNLRRIELKGDLWSFIRGGHRERVPQITDRTAVAFSRSPHLKRLEQLVLYSVHITPDGSRLLNDHFGADRVIIQSVD